MIISAKIIKRPRKLRNCAVCGIPMKFRHLRLFGYAEAGDPPFVIYTHVHCGKYDKNVVRKLRLSGQITEADAIESMQSINYPPKPHSNYIGGSEM